MMVMNDSENGNRARPNGATRRHRQLDFSCHEMLDELEQMDDAVWGAVQGDQQAFARLRHLWPQVSHHLPRELAAESREQYLRYAVDYWRRDLRANEPSSPQTALAALDVMSYLLAVDPEQLATP